MPSEIICLTPFERPDITLLRAIRRTRAFAVLDLGVDAKSGGGALQRACRQRSEPFGVRLRADSPRIELPPDVTCVVLDRPAVTSGFRNSSRFVITQVRSLEEARAAEGFGNDGLIVKGSESGGVVGDETSFVLLQRLLAECELPLWVQGGIGLHTAAAVVALGARGVVLDSQLALAPECSADEPTRRRLSALDGSETRVRDGVRALRSPMAACDSEADELRVGQESAFARELATSYGSAAGIVEAFEQSIRAVARQARKLEPLAPGHGIARSHGMRLPIVQGPMTRVSDRPEFAQAVAGEGALPLLALAVLDGEKTRELMTATAAALGDRPWGVGLLGFAPEEVLRRQMEIVLELRPSVALVAGARKSLVHELTAAGVTTYVHVPSPVLLDQFLRDGITHFVLEGSECGGHIGPRTSFTLWQQAITELCKRSTLESVHVLFAGGIHDSVSAAMVSVLAAPLCARGARVGILVGTAYLFTREAVASGAIAPNFQRCVVDATQTVVLESGPGHAIRALGNEYCHRFEDERRKLQEAGLSPAAVDGALEELNLGRLRIASKGVRREGSELVVIDEDVQRAEGLFMSGQIAGLRRDITTVAALHRELSEEATRRLRSAPSPSVTAAGSDGIAIVGMACLLPQSNDVREYFRHVLRGDDCIQEVPEARWRHALYFGEGAGKDRTVSKWGGFVPVQSFDPREHGIPPHALCGIDPAQILALLVVQRALADAGIATQTTEANRVSVVLGGEASLDIIAQYVIRSFLPGLVGALPREIDARLAELNEDSFTGVLGNLLAGRVSNRLNLGGANYTVNAACASSLAALHCACRDLLSDACDVVVAGGVDLHNSIYDYLMFSKVQALSPDGRCKPFDAKANGIALSEGVAAVVLKRMEDAVLDGDRIYATIRGMGMSSDGRSQSLTAPRLDGQLRALRDAYRVAGVSPADVELIEAHGTGTVLGDRTELEALTRIMLDAGATARGCALSSVKAQIGHTKCAAGMAGLIKAALAIHHGILPAAHNIASVNEFYDGRTNPFALHTEPRPWLSETRRAGVSAFGFGGTNFHVVLENAGLSVAAREAWSGELFVLRGSTRGEAMARARLLRPWLAPHVPSTLRDLAIAAALEWHDRTPVQIALVADSKEHLAGVIEGLESAAAPAGGVYVRRELDSARIAFLFPGQGSQRRGMLRELFCTTSEARAWLEPISGLCESLLEPPHGAPDGAGGLSDTRVAQPLLGACGMAMADVLAACGVTADMSAGHSYGELTALCHAGVLPREQLIPLSRARAEAMVESMGTRRGGMAVIHAGAKDVRLHLERFPDVVVANANAPTQCVIAGDEGSVDRALGALRESGLKGQRLPMPYAFHTPALAPATATFSRALANVALGSARQPVWSNAEAAPYPADPDTVRSLLASQLSRSVRFEELLLGMHGAGARVFVEVGPGEVLTGLVRSTLRGLPHVAIATDRSGMSSGTSLLHALGAIAVAVDHFDERLLVRDRGARRVSLSEEPAQSKHVWLADGRAVWDAALPAPTPFSGAPVCSSLGADATRDDAVHQYLERMGALVEAQRDVMLAYLGAPAEPSARREPGRAAPVTEPSRGPAASETVTGPMDPTLVLRTLLSERTGYPIEMLEADADLEGDLGVDSIKRMEVLDVFVERCAPGETASNKWVERLLRQRTVADIVATLRQAKEEQAGELPQSGDAPVPAPSGAGPDVHLLAPNGSNRHVGSLQRLVSETYPLDVPKGGTRATGKVALSPGAPELSARLAKELAAVGGELVALQAVEQLDASFQHFVCVVDLDDGVADPAKEAFEWCRAALACGVPSVVAVTGLGGRFGIDTSSASRHGGTAGAVKCLAKEYSEQCVRVVDVDLGAAPELLAASLALELRRENPPVEVGCANGQHVGVRTVARARGSLERTHLRPDSVVLVVGGLRGITAAISAALYDRYGCRLEIIGRTDLSELVQCEGLGDLSNVLEARRRIAARSQGRANPLEIEATRKRLCAVQEARRTLDALRARGASIEYHSADVREAGAVARVLDEIYSRHDRIDGVIHAAGVLEDGLAATKTAESFARVYDTKVAGARNLLAALRRDTGFVIFFSSVAATFGNRGQADYAAANDVLDKLARVGQTGSSLKVRSFAWGPWSGAGMVGPELERLYRDRGIDLIAVETGVQAFLDELGSGVEPHVILTAGGWS